MFYAFLFKGVFMRYFFMVLMVCVLVLVTGGGSVPAPIQIAEGAIEKADKADQEKFIFLEKNLEDVKIYFAIVKYIRSVNSRVKIDDARQMSFLIVKYSKEYGLDPLTMAAMFCAESTFNVRTIGAGKYHGLGQLERREFADAVKVFGWDSKADIYDPVYNIPATLNCIRYHKERVIARRGQSSLGEDDLNGILSYNMGFGGASRFGFDRENFHTKKIVSKRYRIQQIFNASTTD